MSVPSLCELALKRVLLDQTTPLCTLPQCWNEDPIKPQREPISPREAGGAVRKACQRILSTIYGGEPADYHTGAIGQFVTTYERIRRLGQEHDQRRPLQRICWNESIAAVDFQIRFSRFFSRLWQFFGNRAMSHAFYSQFNQFLSVHRINRESFSEVIRILDTMRNNALPAQQHRIPTLENLFVIAGAANYWEGLNSLIAEGMDPNVRNDRGQAVLHMAADNGHREAIQVLLAEGANLNVQDGDGWTALHYAADNGHLEAIRVLIAAGAHLNVRNDRSQAPLHRAAAKGHLEAIQALLAAGAPLNVPDDIDQTALHKATAEGHLEAIQALLAAGADPNARYDLDLAPLDVAVHNGNSEAIQVLVDAGADLNVRSLGRTALHRATAQGHLETIQALLAAGADPTIRDNSGESPLRQLLDLGVDINTRYDHGRTALHRAASWDNRDAVRELLAAGGNPAIRDDEGRTPFMIALRHGNFSTVNVLFPSKYKLALLAITGSLLLLDVMLRSQADQEGGGSTSANPDL